MFEQEAKEYAEENKKIYGSDEYADITDYNNVEKTFQEAAEFGYNKANEWQYVSEKGAPKTTGNYHLWLGKCSYSVTYYDGIRFWILSEDPESGWIDVNDVIAWKEIILPKRGTK